MMQRQAANNASSPQQEMLRQRLPVVIVVLLIISAILVLRLFTFQWLPPEVARDFQLRRDANYQRTIRVTSERGIIYDRNGEPLAVNTFQYGIGASPNLISNPRDVATQLAAILNRSELEIYNQLTSDVSWVSIARPVSAEVGQEVARLQQSVRGITREPIPRRFYPQGTLAAHILGFVAGDPQDYRGYNGVEGYYQQQLAGRVRNQDVSTIPFDLPQDIPESDRGSDLVLTLDRDIQFLVETELQLAITQTGATGGTIIVMDPRNGDILAMASYPSFDPNTYFEVTDETVFRNPAISEVYEPGSVMKVVTVAAALELGVITPEWTYNDQGFIDIGGIRIENAERRAYGVVDTAQVLINSLNVGAATIAQEMGWEDFYRMLARFGFGQPTRVDLQGEEAGILKTPYDDDWSESDLGTNSFGQGISVTPLQMITAFAAIANDGLMMQPRVVYQIVDGSEVYTTQPTALTRVVSKRTADIVTDMMVRTVNESLENAQLPGYAIAGKTGTAEISSPLGYERDASIASFIGFLPADAPQVVVLVKLDRPSGYWGSVVAAPVFRRIAERLVILMEIPPDDVRLAIQSQGGAVEEVNR